VLGGNKNNNLRCRLSADIMCGHPRSYTPHCETMTLNLEYLFNLKLVHRLCQPQRMFTLILVFASLLVFELGARTGQTDGQTDGQDL